MEKNQNSLINHISQSPRNQIKNDAQVILAIVRNVRVSCPRFDDLGDVFFLIRFDVRVQATLDRNNQLMVICLKQSP